MREKERERDGGQIPASRPGVEEEEEKDDGVRKFREREKKRERARERGENKSQREKIDCDRKQKPAS